MCVLLLLLSQGVSENIMLGQLCPLGTGAFDLLLNEDDLAAAVDLLAEEDDYDMYGDGSMTPGRMTPGHMTPSRTPHYTPNRCVVHPDMQRHNTRCCVVHFHQRIAEAFCYGGERRVRCTFVILTG